MIGEFILTLVMIMVFGGIVGLIMLNEALGVDIDDIKDYFKTRQKQKTLRKAMEVQKDREALGVADKESSFTEEIEELIEDDQ